MNWRTVFVLATCVLAAAWVKAETTETNLYSGQIWSLVDAKQVMAAAADVTLEKYPNSDQATVERRMERLYRADGTGLAQDESFVKTLTEKGKRNNRQISMGFMLPYSRCEVTTLEVIKPDGKVVPVDVAANSKESIDDSQMSANIYDPNDRVLRVNIPNVEIGDVVHSVTRETTMRAIMPNEFADITMLEDPSYIRHESYEVRGPADRPLQKIAIRDEIPDTVTYTNYTDADGGKVYHWEINNVPRMFDEPAMPPYDQVLQRLLVSTTPDWKAVSRWCWNLNEPHLAATSPDMTNEIKKLTANASTDMEKLKSIFYYVSQKVRYMGLTPETNRPGFEPHDVKITFDKKYGVCRDKACLLVSMLRCAGLNAYPVLINAGAKRDQEVACVDFNHEIASVQFTNGQYVLMDPTDENTKELLPTSDCNRSYLVLRPGGEDLQTSAVQDPGLHMMKIKTTGVLTAAGTLEAKSELEFDGVNDDEYRNAFSHMKPDDRRRFFERDLKEMMPGARLKSLKITPENMTDTSETLRAELEFSAEGMTANGNGKSIVSMPWIGNRLGVVNFILGGAGLEKRKYPMQTYVACGLQEDVALKLEGGFRGAVSMPEIPEENDECSLYNEKFTAKDDELDASREMKLKVVEFSTTQYATLKKELKDLEYDARKAPLMAISESAEAEAAPRMDPVANTTVSSDAQILDSHKEIDVIDAHTSTFKAGYSKKILTYAGKIREAEFKIGFNPSCQSAKLIRGVVVSTNGERKEISPGEINVMDAGWNASAKRYTGGKILVANLPGVDIGTTIEVEYEITSTNKAFVAGYEAFHFPDGLEQKSVELTAPAGLAVHQYVSGQPGVIKADARNDEKGQDYKWSAEHVAPQANEGGTPPSWAFNDGVSYFVGDMKAYLGVLNDMMENRSAKRDKVEDVVKDITSQAKTEIEKAQAIRDYVAKTIRFAGPGFSDLPLSELSAADTTLTDGYGHAADRAILLHAMFSAAGFKPEFVLASGLPPITGITNVAGTFPLPEWFQDPLVKVAIDGVNYYFNDSDQYAKVGAAPCDGKLGLDLASQTTEVIKAAPGCANKIDTTYSLAASDNGLTRITVSRRYYGEDYGWKHKYFAELPPEERHRYYQEVVSGVSQGAKPVGDLITQFDSYPGVEQYTVDVDNYSVVDGKYFYFELPFTPSLYGSGADQRTLPLFFSGRNENTVRTEIQLPPGFTHVVMAPGSVSLDGPDGSGMARITATDTPGKCVLTDDFETDPSIIDPKDYPEVLKLEASLGKKSSRMFLLEKD